MKAEFEIVKLNAEDIVTTSTTTPGGGGNPLCGIVPGAIN